MDTINKQLPDQDLGNKSNNTSNYLCRQSGTRWTPTSDQIRILKELYYNNGIRSPTADQIQRIAARLRHYGKIEGKNVFYWFQNHKARERQKKRFIPPPTPPQPPSSTAAAAIVPPLFPDHHHHHHHHMPYFYNHQSLNLHATHHIPPPEGGSSSSSSQAFLPVGCSYGAITMEHSFRDCSISPGEKMVPGGETLNLGSWIGVNSCSFDKMMPENETPEDDNDGVELSTEIETLPLFPIPGGSTTTTAGSHHDMFNMKESVSSEHGSGGFYSGGSWFRSDGRASLELSLNSYGYYE